MPTEQETSLREKVAEGEQRTKRIIAMALLLSATGITGSAIGFAWDVIPLTSGKLLATFTILFLFFLFIAWTVIANDKVKPPPQFRHMPPAGRPFEERMPPPNRKPLSESSLPEKPAPSTNYR